MSKTKFILMFAFLLTLAAGAGLGMVGSRKLPPKDRHSWLTEELSLTPDQEQKMKEIWSNVMRGGREHSEKHRAAQRERDEAVVGLLSAEQKEKYDQIMAQYQARIEDLSQERERAFAQAVEETKKILTDEQRKKYEELMSRRRGEHGERGGRGRGPGPGPDLSPHGPPREMGGGPPTRGTR